MDISILRGFVNIGFLSPEEISRGIASAALNLGLRSFFLHQNAETAMQRFTTAQRVESDYWGSALNRTSTSPHPSLRELGGRRRECKRWRARRAPWNPVLWHDMTWHDITSLSQTHWNHGSSNQTLRTTARSAKIPKGSWTRRKQLKSRNKEEGRRSVVGGLG